MKLLANTVSFIYKMFLTIQLKNEYPYFVFTVINKSTAGMQHTPPRDIFNDSNVNQGL